MNWRVSITLAAFFAVSAFAQRNGPNYYGSPSGFGNINYPGTGHPPAVLLPGAISDPGFPSRYGASIRGFSPYSGVGFGRVHPSHSRQVIVPVPIYIGGGYPYDAMAGGYYQDPGAAQVQQDQQQAPPPVVIINQTYRPETAAPEVRYYSDQPSTRSYDAPVHPMPDPNEPQSKIRSSGAGDKATIYLIAFKDHTILPALAYWMEGDTLNYISQQGTPNRVSLTLVDRDFSRQLNSERQVEFNLP